MKKKAHGKVIDFQKVKNNRKSRKRKLWLAVLMCVATVLALVGWILYIQFQALTEDKGFWQNFQSSASQIGSAL